MPAPTVTRFIITCLTQNFSVTGTDFSATSTISLIGPDGQVANFTVSHLTPTKMTLHLSDPLLSGEYCITVI